MSEAASLPPNNPQIEGIVGAYNAYKSDKSKTAKSKLKAEIYARLENLASLSDTDRTKNVLQKHLYSILTKLTTGSSDEQIDNIFNKMKEDFPAPPPRLPPSLHPSSATHRGSIQASPRQRSASAPPFSLSPSPKPADEVTHLIQSLTEEAVKNLPRLSPAQVAKHMKNVAKYTSLEELNAEIQQKAKAYVDGKHKMKPTDATGMHALRTARNEIRSLLELQQVWKSAKGEPSSDEEQYTITVELAPQKSKQAGSPRSRTGSSPGPESLPSPSSASSPESVLSDVSSPSSPLSPLASPKAKPEQPPPEHALEQLTEHTIVADVNSATEQSKGLKITVEPPTVEQQPLVNEETTPQRPVPLVLTPVSTPVSPPEVQPEAEPEPTGLAALLQGVQLRKTPKAEPKPVSAEDALTDATALAMRERRARIRGTLKKRKAKPTKTPTKAKIPTDQSPEKAESSSKAKMPSKAATPTQATPAQLPPVSDAIQARLARDAAKFREQEEKERAKDKDWDE